MNKKFSTFLVGALLAMGVNGFAQSPNVWVESLTNQDAAKFHTGSPTTSIQEVSPLYGAKPISRIQNVDNGPDSRYYQFVVKGEPTKVLSTVYDATSKTYKIVVEDVRNAPKLDRTLWQVEATKIPTTTLLRYELINKASQGVFQLANPDVQGEANANTDLDVIKGSLVWRWADGAYSGDNSTPSWGYFRAELNGTESVYLGTNASGELALIRVNTNTLVNGTPADAVTFEAWEANPIQLTAHQINTELGYENPRTNITSDKAYIEYGFKFTFNPDVVGSKYGNVLVGKEFIAEDTEDVLNSLYKNDEFFKVENPGSTPKGFVRFRQKTSNYKTEAWNKKNYLRVDTSYITSVISEEIKLQMAVAPIQYESSGVAADEAALQAVAPAGTTVKLTVGSDGRLYNNGTIVDFDDADYTSNKVIAQLKRQSNFRAVYYPATQLVHLQAEAMIQPTKTQLSAASNWRNLIATTDISNSADPYKLAQVDGGFDYLTYGTVTGNSNANWKGVGSLNTTDVTADIAYTTPNNVVRIDYLTDDHSEVTCTTLDATKNYNGLLTNISFADLKTIKEYNSNYADIKEGYYYIQNANKVSTSLQKVNNYRYQDLAATNRTYAFYNTYSGKWEVGTADNTYKYGEWDGRAAYTSEEGNIVYSEDLKRIPSAQFYFEGNGGHYTIYNRESGDKFNTSYWWKADGEENVYVNLGTVAGGTTGAEYRDTIRLIPVPTADLEKHVGYLNLTQAQAKADTTVFQFQFNSVGGVELLLGQAAGKDSLLKVMNDTETNGLFKLEKVNVRDRDNIMLDDKYENELPFGHNASGLRAMYYIYLDEVSSNSTQTTGIQTRKYVTLEGGKYRIATVEVNVAEDGYTTSTDAAVIAGTKVEPRKAFYVKQIATEEGAENQYVLVDPFMVNRDDVANGSEAYGVRLFVNQSTAEIQPAGLTSGAASNVYDNSVFSLVQVKKYNYRDVRTEGNVRDTLMFTFDGSEKQGEYALFASGNLKSQGKVAIDLLGWINVKEANKNHALFVDTANVSKDEFPRFLLGVNQVDTREKGDITDDNKDEPISTYGGHLYTTADYLVNLIDSAATNNNYKYTNSAVNNKNYYRLGFVRARHEGDKLYIGAKKDAANTIDLSGDGLNYATFAFRYISTDRNNFFIETAYDAEKTGWIKIINEVAVVVPDIQEATPFDVEETEDTPTSNAVVEGSAVQVIAGNGAVTVKNAAGKKVVISNILGQTVANSTVSSDNATIAVPAGVVVVAVEGETAVKAVVR